MDIFNHIKQEINSSDIAYIDVKIKQHPIKTEPWKYQECIESDMDVELEENPTETEPWQNQSLFKSFKEGFRNSRSLKIQYGVITEISD